MYEQMTTAALADLADARLASVPGCAALPAVIWAAWPSFRTSEKRRARLIAALAGETPL